ncbi:hypotheticalsprotein [Cercospora beticola]|uniref:Hypotheticalsprotein n=1 Tax=Cercospora beticola TaxID=122368 RepID=A0A2G5HH45_CERBT|nr:hypotheticalsprotein [Cercospora beticola]PIA91858.1 hypotheticalsprotein [Cercospora beticola]WPB06106.1 hypothetical protein RHO25_010763 [Cercospora beticola]CAK1365989.1 unnamed protein product [Cercospora beticola]
MASPTRIDVDYLVAGAGAMGMAFVDTILASSVNATVALIDRNSRPGGHWTTAYPFVRLHQPSSFYGVSSRHLGTGKIDQIGLNRGHYELATGDEVSAYYAQVLHETFLPSGRVQYFARCIWKGDTSFQSILTGEAFQVGSRTKIVDATYMKLEVPSMRPPPYQVAEGVTVRTPNDLVNLSRPYANYTVVGAGKTGMDTCIWLLTNGVDPNRVTWIMPRDSWLFDRAFFGKDNAEAIKKRVQATMLATAPDDMFRRYEASGQFLRLDQEVWPTMFRCATVSRAELEELRRIKNIVRLGRVLSIDVEKVTLQHGSYTTVQDIVFVDYTADGAGVRPPVAVFSPIRITLQPVRYCQQVFSAAFIAHVESAYDDEQVKNELCRPVLQPSAPIDMLVVSYQDNLNALRWCLESKTVAWLSNCRLDFFSKTWAPLLAEDPEEREAARQRFRAQRRVLCDKLRELLREEPAAEAKIALAKF